MTTHRSRSIAVLAALALGAVLPLDTRADLTDIVRCQRRIAGAGAAFARTTINSAVNCAAATAECQIQCEQGAFGFPCDPDDVGSNAGFAACMAEAEDYCDQQAIKVDNAEIRKRNRIILACDDLTLDELCGGETPGLNFATLDAGCQALDPTYQCSLDGIVECVGGPLERELANEVATLLGPRAPEGLALLNLQNRFPGVPIARKVQEHLPAGKIDVWSVTGQAGDLVSVSLATRNDDGNGNSALDAALTVLASDGETPLGSTTVAIGNCPVPTVCGAGCPKLKRRLPFDGTFFLAVAAQPSPGCVGGQYRLTVTTRAGMVPILVGNNLDPPGTP
jgi:hypothetical protein